MKKTVFKIMSAALVLAILISSVLAVSADSFVVVETDFEFTETETGISITGYLGDDTEIVIPETINGKPVVSIAPRAFSNMNITGVTFPASLVCIGEYAFYKTELSVVSIPANVSLIDIASFAGCKKLEEIRVEEGNENYDSCDGVLYTADMTELLIYPAAKSDTEFVVPDSVKTIKDAAFRCAKNLVTVIISDNVEVLEEYAFSECLNLKNIELPESIHIIDAYVFYRCIALESIIIPENVICINYHAFDGCKSLHTVETNDKIEYIGNSAFEDCSSLSSIGSLIALRSMGSDVFNGCESLERIEFGAVFMKMENMGFDNCSSLASITVVPGNLTFDSEDGVLFNEGKTDLLKYPAGKKDESYVVPESVEIITASAFEGNTWLKEVVISEGVKEISWDAFSDCELLEKIVLPESVMRIGDNAFEGTAYYNNAKNWKDGLLFIDDCLVACGDIHHDVNGDIGDVPDCLELDVKLVASDVFWQTGIKELYVKADFIRDAFDEFTAEYLYLETENISKGTIMFCSIDKIHLKANSIANMALCDCYDLKEVVLECENIGEDIFSQCYDINTITVLSGNVPAEFFDCDNIRNDVILNVSDEVKSFDIDFSDQSEVDKMRVTINYEGTSEQWEAILTDVNGISTLPETVMVNFEAVFETGKPSEDVTPPEEDRYDYEYIDTESGISVSTDTEAELSVENIMTEEIVASIDELLPRAMVESVFEINLQSEGEEIQPVDKVTVKIPTNNRFARVYRMEEDGALTDMNARYEDGYLIFTTDHFSYYALGSKIASLYELGDADMDEKITVKDATTVQKHLADLEVYQPDAVELLMDFDGDGSLTVRDATAIQKTVAGLR